jgi:hypothetical protein
MARLDEDQQTVDGETFSALIESVTTSRLDTAKIKADSDPDWLAEQYKTSSHTTIRVTRRK